MHRLAVAVLLLLVATTTVALAASADEVLQAPGTTPTAPLIITACTDGNINGRCLRLPAHTYNVKVDPHGICRWLDNASTRDYFVPYQSRIEWEAFIDHAPDGVTADLCCPIKQTQLGILSDGRVIDVALPLGRSNESTWPNPESASPHTSVRKEFQVSKNLCTTHFNGTETCTLCHWTEVLEMTATCTAGEWITTATKSGGPDACEAPAYIGPANCGTGFLHNTKRWVVSGPSSRPGTTATCSYEGELETEFACWNGAQTPTGNTRVINEELIGECFPPEPLPETPTGGCGSGGCHF